MPPDGRQRPFIIMSAPNGARRDKTQHPQLPLSPDELAECAEAVLREGASVLHLHVRDEKNEHSLSPARYRDAIGAIRNRVGDALVVQVTTEACGIYTPVEQMDAVRALQPEAVSIALRELLPDVSCESALQNFAAWMRERGIMAQVILYTPEEVDYYKTLRARGVLGTESAFVLFVLGSHAEGVDGEPRDIRRFVDRLQDESVGWAVCCFGGKEDEAVRQAALARGHARVGFENNLQLPDGSQATDNAMLVRLAANHGRATGRRIAIAADVRSLFGYDR